MENFKLRKQNRQAKMDRKRYHQPIPNRERNESRKERYLRKYHPLTEAEERVCMPLSYGKTHKEIAHEQGIATNTVSKHIQNVQGKLGLNKETALSRWVTEVENGLPVTVGKRA